MKSPVYYFNKIRKMSLCEIWENVVNLVINPELQKIRKMKDRVVSPFVDFENSNDYLIPLFDKCIDGVETSDVSFLKSVCKNYLNHEFDILGSGWKKNGYIDNADGLMGYKYDPLVLNRDSKNNWLYDVLDKVDVKFAKKIYENIPLNYEPIDWQKDIKTGYRWSAKYYYRPIKYINADLTPGVDIKVPWELSRLQHLTRLAYLVVFGDLSEPEKHQYVIEYKNQILDFIAQNPVRKGVNWYCTMDVGIRTANIALSYSLLKLAAVEFDDYFENMICASVKVHCKFIKNNLEWSSTCRSNHYLSDICGLLFGAAVLPESKKGKNWIRFARNEIENEILLQFHEDGSNFEASVGYHRLSAELALYSCALINRLAFTKKCDALPSKVFNRLYNSACFMKDMVLPDGTFYQCGDNDSGRFFNISPIGEYLRIEELKNKYMNLKSYEPLDEKDEPYFDEQMNAPDALLSAFNEFFSTNEFDSKYDCIPERNIIKFLLSEARLKNTFHKNLDRVREKTDNTIKSDLDYKKETVIDFPEELRGSLNYTEYPDFGISVFSAENLFLAVCWSDNGQNGNAGHTHNDKLSFELWIAGKPIIRDPGTFVYTPLPELRNVFRSVAAHSTVNCGIEQNDFLTLFSMTNDSRCTVLKRNIKEIRISLVYKDMIFERSFEILENRLLIKDESNVAFENTIRQKYLTAGYGKLLKLERRIYDKGNDCFWNKTRSNKNVPGCNGTEIERKHSDCCMCYWSASADAATGTGYI